MHTIKVIAAGLLLLAVCLAAGRLAGGPAIAAATPVKFFIPLWLAGTLFNMYIGVTRAGYPVADELPIFLAVFTVPVAVALLIGWKF